MMMGRSAFVASLLDPLFSGTYAVPKLALFPIFIFVFGLGSLSKIALIFLECLYPMTIITYHGARSVDRVLLCRRRTLGLPDGGRSWAGAFRRRCRSFSPRRRSGRPR